MKKKRIVLTTGIIIGLAIITSLGYFGYDFYIFGRVFWAAGEGDTGTLKSFLEAHPELDKKILDHALRGAISEYQLGSMQVLLEHGANANATDSSLGYPLLIRVIIIEKRIEMVRLLLEYGADANVKDRDGDPVLMIATREGDSGAVQLLLEHGADVNKEDTLDDTALLIATEEGNTAMVSVLLKYGANVNAKYSSNMTVLIEAANKEHTEIVKILVEYGANVNDKNELGDTALIVAASRGWPAPKVCTTV